MLLRCLLRLLKLQYLLIMSQESPNLSPQNPLFTFYNESKLPFQSNVFGLQNVQVVKSIKKKYGNLNRQIKILPPIKIRRDGQPDKKIANLKCLSKTYEMCKKDATLQEKKPNKLPQQMQRSDLVNFRDLRNISTNSPVINSSPLKISQLKVRSQNHKSILAKRSKSLKQHRILANKNKQMSQAKLEKTKIIRNITQVKTEIDNQDKSTENCQILFNESFTAQNQNKKRKNLTIKPFQDYLSDQQILPQPVRKLKIKSGMLPSDISLLINLKRRSQISINKIKVVPSKSELKQASSHKMTSYGSLSKIFLISLKKQSGLN